MICRTLRRVFFQLGKKNGVLGQAWTLLGRGLETAWTQFGRVWENGFSHYFGSLEYFRSGHTIAGIINREKQTSWGEANCLLHFNTNVSQFVAVVVLELVLKLVVR